MSEQAFKKGDIVVAKPEFRECQFAPPWALVKWVVIRVAGDMFRAKVKDFPGHKEAHQIENFEKV